MHGLRNPLFQGSIFSCWRLHVRISLETSQEVLPSLDLWHLHHNINVIETNGCYDIKIVALTSHITTRSCRHIQLNCFGVSLPSITCVAFLSFFCFHLYEYYFLVLFECLMSFTCILSCPNIVSVLIAILLLSHA